MIEVKDVHQNFGDTPVLAGVNLEFKSGINMLMGPSGCGKSTLLKMLGGVRPDNIKCPTSGEVLIAGESCYAAHDDVVMVFQKYANRPDLTALENITFPFQLKLWRDRVPEPERIRRVEEILKVVGLEHKKMLLPSELSGGQNQRVALARALVLRPKILLLDEPFGALDPQTRTEMQQLLLRLLAEQECLVVFVTHDVDEALLLADEVTVLSRPPAKVQRRFTIDVPKPRSEIWLQSSAAVTLRAQLKQSLLAQEGI